MSIKPWTNGRDPIAAVAIRRAAEQYKTTPRAIMSNGCRPESNVSAARRQVIVELHNLRGFSIKQITHELGGMHHSSVVRHLQRQREIENFIPAGPIDLSVPDLSGEWAI